MTLYDLELQPSVCNLAKDFTQDKYNCKTRQIEPSASLGYSFWLPVNPCKHRMPQPAGYYNHVVRQQQPQRERRQLHRRIGQGGEQARLRSARPRTLTPAAPAI